MTEDQFNSLSDANVNMQGWGSCQEHRVTLLFHHDLPGSSCPFCIVRDSGQASAFCITSGDYRVRIEVVWVVPRSRQCFLQSRCYQPHYCVVSLGSCFPRRINETIDYGAMSIEIPFLASSQVSNDQVRRCNYKTCHLGISL